MLFNPLSSLIIRLHPIRKENSRSLETWGRQIKAADRPGVEWGGKYVINHDRDPFFRGSIWNFLCKPRSLESRAS